MKIDSYKNYLDIIKKALQGFDMAKGIYGTDVDAILSKMAGSGGEQWKKMLQGVGVNQRLWESILASVQQSTNNGDTELDWLKYQDSKRLMSKNPVKFSTSVLPSDRVSFGTPINDLNSETFSKNFGETPESHLYDTLWNRTQKARDEYAKSNATGGYQFPDTEWGNSTAKTLRAPYMNPNTGKTDSIEEFMRQLFEQYKKNQANAQSQSGYVV